jgi:hypothetical protein
MRGHKSTSNIWHHSINFINLFLPISKDKLMCAYYTPRSSFSSNSFTPKYNFVETPQPTQPQPAHYDDEPDVVWEKKEEILEKRQKCFKKDGKKKEETAPHTRPKTFNKIA